MTQSSFYADGDVLDAAVVESNDVPAATAPTSAPSGFYPGGTAYTTLQNADDVLAQLEAATAATLAAQAAAEAAASASDADAAAAHQAYLDTVAAGGGGAGALLKANNLSDLTNVAQAKANLALVKGDVGLGNADDTSDANKPVSTAQQTALNLKANIAGPTFTGSPAAPTAAPGTNTTQLATTAFVEAARVILAAADALKAPLASPALTGIPTAPTAAANTNSTQLATTAYVDAADAILAAALVLRAPLDSPALTGTPTAPTAAPGTNTTQLATTAFVDAARALLQTAINAKANLASPALTGTPTAPTAANGTNTTQIATTAFVLANGGSGGGSPPIPQFRLTLQTDVPVMVTSQASKTTLYLTPYGGSNAPFYNGTTWSVKAFAELSCLTTDTTKNPAAIGANKLNDWFYWDDGGTIRLGHGPDWTNDTTRSLALTKVGGVLMNASAITNGPAASRGVYVGTTRSDASSQLNWVLGGSASGGSPALLNVWNMYNRFDVAARVEDTFTSTTFAAGTAPFNGSTNNRVSYVVGLAEDPVSAVGSGYIVPPSSAQAGIGQGFDSTSVNSALGQVAYSSGGTVGFGLTSTGSFNVIGFHYIQALQTSTAAGANAYGSGVGLGINAGLIVRGRF